jgi:hypothetical protein
MKLMLSENRVLKTTSGPKRQKVRGEDGENYIPSEEFQNMNSYWLCYTVLEK